MGPFEALFLIIGIAFLASFAEVGIFAATNTLVQYQIFVGGQMIASILLLMLFAAILIMRDVRRK
ncbi:MAG: hypothetical protein ACRECH_01985 [Nitrososphaerales archaeon]